MNEVKYTYLDEDGDEIRARYTSENCLCTMDCYDDKVEFYSPSMDDYGYLTVGHNEKYFIKEVLSSAQELSDVKEERDELASSLTQTKERLAEAEEKPHQVRELVNELTAIAIKYRSTQQLRARMAKALNKFLTNKQEGE